MPRSGSRLIKFILLWLVRPALSLIIGGWLSKDLFYPSEARNTNIASTYLTRLLPVFILSIVIAFAVLAFNSWAPDDDWHALKKLSEWGWLFAPLALYQFARKIWQKKYILASQWIYPLIIFNIMFYLPNWNNICDQLDRAKFSYYESYYDNLVKNIPAKRGKPKYMAVYWGYNESDATFLTYDESDQESSAAAISKKYFTKQDLDYGNYVKSVKKLKSHYYLIVFHYQNTYYGDGNNKIGNVSYK